jgi:hypothetical protein
MDLTVTTFLSLEGHAGPRSTQRGPEWRVRPGRVAGPLRRLTAAGRRAQARAEEAVDAHALQFFGRLTRAERAELHRLLARLIERPE